MNLRSAPATPAMDRPANGQKSRLKISRFATALASPIMKTRLSDPMSGFFAVRRDVLLEAAPRLSNVGYKILLDLVASHPRPLKLAEVGYTFGTRQHGESKLDEMVALEYLELLLDKSDRPLRAGQAGPVRRHRNAGRRRSPSLLYLSTDVAGRLRLGPGSGGDSAR